MSWNMTSGEIRVDLATSDPCEDGIKPRTLFAFLDLTGAGDDDTDHIELMEREPGNPHGCGQVWIVPIARLRKVLDMIESAQAVGRLGWQQTEGENR